ncbi:hypothetical protein ACTXGL_09765 [Psychrobacter sp. T6-6]|uniref:hypothetical protein n=1 Tax=Psychrobacter sp. T6-6 TaxID=3457452 RepID=UPI003FD0E021
MNDAIVIKIGSALLKADTSWLWSGYNATTADYKKAMMFHSIESAKDYYKEMCGVVKDKGEVSYMRLSMEIAQ